MIKIQQNGVKWEGGYTPCFYSTDSLDSCVIIYARDYEHLPAELGNVQNDTDSREDYFEGDRVKLYPGDKYYSEALAAYKKRRVADSKRWLKHSEKQLEKELSGYAHPGTVEYLRRNIENYKKIIAAGA